MPDTYNPKSIQWVLKRKAFCIFVVNEDDNRYVPYVNNDGNKRFVGNWNNLDNDMNDNGRMAVSSNWR